MEETTPVEYLDIVTEDGTLRILYQLDVGDLLVASVVVLVIVLQLILAVHKALWRR